MLRADKLQQIGDVFQCNRPECSSLSAMKEALQAISRDNAIPMAFENDQIGSGGLLNRQVDDCLVVFHPQHPGDYFRFCVSAKQQGPAVFVRVYGFGRSKQSGKDAAVKFAREDRKGKKLSYKVGSLIAQAVLTAGRSKTKLEEEENYYTLVKAALAEVLG